MSNAKRLSLCSGPFVPSVMYNELVEKVNWLLGLTVNPPLRMYRGPGNPVISLAAGISQADPVAGMDGYFWAQISHATERDGTAAQWSYTWEEVDMGDGLYKARTSVSTGLSALNTGEQSGWSYTGHTTPSYPSVPLDQVFPVPLGSQVLMYEDKDTDGNVLGYEFYGANFISTVVPEAGPMAIELAAFFVKNKLGVAGLTVTVDLYDPTGTKVVTAGSATELGGGIYIYVHDDDDAAEGTWRAVFKTSDSTVDHQHIPSQIYHP
jgi:hypothetical protein